MLNKLIIKNYAIIDHLEIDFAPDLNVITGETGAGKSIIIGALSLILGQRADSRSLYDTTQKCVIEGHFSIISYQLESFFKENDLDYDPLTIIRREIMPDGKSRAFINDTPATLSTLKLIGEQLVDIHSQHETLELNSSKFQLMVVDAFCDHADVFKTYQSSYRKYQSLQQTLSELSELSAKNQAESDFLQFQFNELEQARFSDDEQQLLETELNTLSHAEEIKKVLNQNTQLMQDDELSILPNLKKVVSAIQGIEKFNPAIQIIAERAQSSLIELRDITAEIETLSEQIAVNPERMAAVQERLDLIYKLEHKHRVSSVPELIQVYKNIEEKLFSITSLDSEIENLKIQIGKLHTDLVIMADKLSAKRRSVIPAIEKNVQKMLTEVGMPNSEFIIRHQFRQEQQLSLTGTDEIQFLFSANKGFPASDIRKVASGGELSRLMLCIKSNVAGYLKLPTIIFDEIDTGVSGEVALKVGMIMEQLSHSLQVFTITHLPQIASKGNSHYFVYKEERSDKSVTKIKKLNESDRIVEIAKMLSGDRPGENALSNAKELLNQS